MCFKSYFRFSWIVFYFYKGRQKTTIWYFLQKFTAVIFLLLFTLELAGFENEKALESFGIDPCHCAGFVGGIRGFFRL